MTEPISVAAGTAIFLLKASTSIGLKLFTVNPDGLADRLLEAAAGNFYYDILKLGGSKAWNSAIARLQSNDGKNLPLNYDLQKAIREAQLNATIFACENCFEKLKTEDRTLFERMQSWRGFNAEEAWLVNVIQSLKRNLDDIKKDDYVPPSLADVSGILQIATPPNSFPELHQDFSETSSELLKSQLREIESKDLIVSLKENIIQEIRILHAPSINQEKIAADFVNSINNGWKIKGREFDWYELVCDEFNEIYKKNERVWIALQNLLFYNLKSDLVVRYQNFTAIHLEDIGNKILSKLEGLKRIENKQVFLTEFLVQFRDQEVELLSTIIDKVDRQNQFLATIHQDHALVEQAHPSQIKFARGYILGEELRLSLSNIFVGKYHKHKLKELRTTVFNGKSSVIIISCPPGFGKASLFYQLLKEAKFNTPDQNPDVDNAIIISSRYGEIKDVLRVIADKIDELSVLDGSLGNRKTLREILSPNINAEAGGEERLDKKCAIIIDRFLRLNKVWLILDGCEKWLEGNENTEANPLKKFLSLFTLSVNSGDTFLPRIIITSTIRILGINARVINLNKPFDKEDAIKFLKEMAKVQRTNWKLEKSETEKYLAKLVDEGNLPRIPGDLLAFVDYFNTRSNNQFDYNLKDAVLEIESRQYQSKKNKRVYSFFLQEQFKLLNENEKLVWFALSVFRRPVSLKNIVEIFNQHQPDEADGPFDNIIVEKTLREHSWIIETTKHGESKFELEQFAKKYVFDKLLDAFSLLNHVSFIRYFFHREAAKIYAKATENKPINSYDDLDDHIEEIYHLTESKQFGTAAYRLSQIDFKFLIKWGYPETLISLRENLGENLKSPFAKAQHNNSLSVAYGRIGNKNKAIEHGLKALSLFQSAQVKTSKSRGRACSDLAEAYSGAGNKQKALQYYLIALKEQEEANDYRFRSRTLLNLGQVYGEMGQLYKALEKFKQALKIYRTRNGDSNEKIKRDEGRVCLNIGIIRTNMGLFSKAKLWFDKALKIHKKSGDRIYLGRTLGNLAELITIETAFSDGNSDRAAKNKIFPEQRDKLLLDAEHLFDQSLEIAKKMQDRDSERRRTLRQGILYHIQGKIDQAHRNYQSVIGLNNPIGNCRTYILLGILQLQKGKKKDAENSFNSSIDICEKLKRESPNYYVPRFCHYIALLGLDKFQEAKVCAEKELQWLWSENEKHNLKPIKINGIIIRCQQYLKLMKLAEPQKHGVAEILHLMSTYLDAAEERPKANLLFP